ncbi:MAG: hypothetical protein LBG88_00345 [Christensenellaceae bacterium]|nr:hypothetical protein [Christensenellaceae bacterium]
MAKPYLTNRVRNSSYGDIRNDVRNGIHDNSRGVLRNSNGRGHKMPSR